VSVDARIARGGVLGLWALFFVVLWATGTSDRFLGPRTQWIVPFGAVVLSLATLAYAYGYVRSRRSGPSLTLREAASLFALLVPLAAVSLVPHAALGSYAASRKGGISFAFVRPHAPAEPSQASFLDIRIAEGDRGFAADAGIRPGLRVRLLGFVVGSKDVPRGTFQLTRFYIACCIADAEAVGVPVQGRGPQPNTWLEVTGALARRGKRFVVVPDTVTRVRAPKQPYLSFQT
jgi:putative membrane protein